MKNWNKPEISELNIANTQWDSTTGTKPDSWIHEVGTPKENDKPYKFEGNSGSTAQ